MDVLSQKYNNEKDGRNRKEKREERRVKKEDWVSRRES